MKEKKLIRYRLGVSRKFPKTHPRAGEQTYFVEKIIQLFEIGVNRQSNVFNFKLHTIRANYPLWEKRMKKVQAGEAVIELFYLSGEQVVFATLDKDSGCGVQELCFENFELEKPYEFDGNWQHYLQISELAKNDGLSLQDFKAWFKGYDLSKPMAIIHFTSFRY